MKIRFAEVSDFKSLALLTEKITEIIENKAIFNWQAESLLTELQSVQTLLIETDHGVLSYICYRDLGDCFEISALGTHPRQQKKGYQSQLILKLQQLAKERQARIILEVHCDNKSAQELYQKMNFKKLTIRKAYYKDKADAFVMGWNN